MCPWRYECIADMTLLFNIERHVRALHIFARHEISLAGTFSVFRIFGFFSLCLIFHIERDG